MISPGTEAPDFALTDQFGRKVTLSQFKNKQHVMILAYPLDFTPTWSLEIPSAQALLEGFQGANTQVLGLSIDSFHCHANWGESLGGISFPLLSDFQPKGAVADSYDMYLEKHGMTARATVIIDAGGKVHFAESVSDERNISDLAAKCEELNKTYSGNTEAAAKADKNFGSSELFIRNNCGASRKAWVALANLGLGKNITLRNASEDAGAMSDLEKASGKKQAPCLVRDGKAILEAEAIVKLLADQAAPI